MEENKTRILIESESLKEDNESLEFEQHQNSIAKFLKIISKGLNRHGAKKIHSVLVNLDISSDFEKKGIDKLIKFICSETVDNFNKNKEERVYVKDIFEKDKRGDVTLARQMVMILLTQFVDITPTMLGQYLNRSRQVIHTAMARFKELDPKLSQDCDFLNRHDAISSKIILYMEKNHIKIKE